MNSMSNMKANGDDDIVDLTSPISSTESNTNSRNRFCEPSTTTNIKKTGSSSSSAVEIIDICEDDNDESINGNDTRKPAANIPAVVDLTNLNAPQHQHRQNIGRKKSKVLEGGGGGICYIDTLPTNDEVVANKLHEEEVRKQKEKDEEERTNELLAKRLQDEEDRASRKANPKKEQRRMMKTNTGRAVLAVERIINLVETMKNQLLAADQNENENENDECIEPVARDDIVFLAERLLQKQEEFKANGIPFHVCIGYHYTDERNMNDIRTNGLMTKAERDTKNVTVASKGAVFGDGIYTANNPTSFMHFGQVGLIVARLQGKSVQVPGSLLKSRNEDTVNAVNEANTIIGDKSATTSTNWPKSDKLHEFILRSSSQCLPMIKYKSSIITSKVGGGETYIHKFTDSLRLIIDEVFNNGVKSPPLATVSGAIPDATATPASGYISAPFASSHLAAPTITRPVPTFGVPAYLPTTRTRTRTRTRNATSYSPVSAHLQGIPSQPALRNNLATTPSHSPYSASTNSSKRRKPSSAQASKLNYRAPEKLDNGIPSNAFIPYHSCKEECVICQDNLSTESSIKLAVCKHSFHLDCIKQALEVSSQCPICRKSVGEPRGKSPSGTMNVSRSSTSCDGYHPSVGSIVIDYSMKSELQKTYHDNPGTIQMGKTARAYLPDNTDGRKLLKRLQYAFLRGLAFTVGTSVTTGASNQCTWSSIHHKTSPHGGISSHGFPDPSYLMNCNDELNNLSVPLEHLLRDDGTIV